MIIIITDNNNSNDNNKNFSCINNDKRYDGKSFHCLNFFKTNKVNMTYYSQGLIEKQNQWQMVVQPHNQTIVPNV